jgi:hypothetical protein
VSSVFARAGVNNFQNPAARDLALTAPVNGTVCFVRQDAVGTQINELQYYFNGWVNVLSGNAATATFATTAGTAAVTGTELSTSSLTTLLSSSTLTLLLTASKCDANSALSIFENFVLLEVFFSLLSLVFFLALIESCLLI